MHLVKYPECGCITTHVDGITGIVVGGSDDLLWHAKGAVSVWKRTKMPEEVTKGELQEVSANRKNW